MGSVSQKGSGGRTNCKLCTLAEGARYVEPAVPTPLDGVINEIFGSSRASVEIWAKVMAAVVDAKKGG